MTHAFRSRAMKYAVIDSGPLIKGVRLETIGAERYVTVPEVLLELRDRHVRERLAALPFELETREPSQEALDVIRKFAKLTGDLPALSAVDIRVLALAWLLEKETKNGVEHLRTTPLLPGASARSRRALPADEPSSSTAEGMEDEPAIVDDGEDGLDESAVTEQAAAAAAAAAATGAGMEDDDDDEEAAEAEAALLAAIASRDAEGGAAGGTAVDVSDVSGTAAATSVAVAAAGAPVGAAGGTSIGCSDGAAATEQDAAAAAELAEALEARRAARRQAEEAEAVALRAAEAGAARCEHSREAGAAAASAGSGGTRAAGGLESSRPGGLDDEGAEPWITVDNLKTMQQRDGQRYAYAPDASTTVACLTTDYAMQSVLMQMNLKLLGADGMILRSVKQWVMRCSGCFTQQSSLESQFCSKCGNMSLVRLQAVVDDRGQQRLLPESKAPARVRSTNTRGTKFPLPMPVAGRHAHNLILAEDQLAEAVDKARRQGKAKLEDVFDPDYSLEDHFGRAGSKRPVRNPNAGSAMPKVGYGKRVNPNDVRARPKRT